MLCRSCISSYHCIIMLLCRYYNHAFHNFLHPEVKEEVGKTPACADIAFNIMVSYITKHPPVKVAQKHGIRYTPFSSTLRANATYLDDHSLPESPKSLVFAQRQRCLRLFATAFGGMPLAYSQVWKPVSVSATFWTLLQWTCLSQCMDTEISSVSVSGRSKIEQNEKCSDCTLQIYELC